MVAGQGVSPRSATSLRTTQERPDCQVTAPRRRHRIEVRVNPQQDALIRQAADIENTTVTAFVLDTVTAKAEQVVRRHRDLVLANEDFDRFIAELDKPAAPVPELAALFEHYPKLPEA
jgi:uncharacterized protein (DUF1778 family)